MRCARCVILESSTPPAEDVAVPIANALGEVGIDEIEIQLADDLVGAPAQDGCARFVDHPVAAVEILHRDG